MRSENDLVCGAAQACSVLNTLDTRRWCPCTEILTIVQLILSLRRLSRVVEILERTPETDARCERSQEQAEEHAVPYFFAEPQRKIGEYVFVLEV